MGHTGYKRHEALNQTRSCPNARNEPAILVLNHAAEEWKRAPREWFMARTQFAVVFGEGSSAMKPPISPSPITAVSIRPSSTSRGAPPNASKAAA